MNQPIEPEPPIDDRQASVAQCEPWQRDSRALLDAIVQSLPFRVWACDLEGRCILQNAPSVRDFGPQLGQLANNLPLAPESLARWQRNVARALAGEVVTEEATVPLDSGPQTYRYTIAPIRDEETIRGTIGVDIDISELRRAEAALYESEQRLRNITENAPDIILQATRDGTITYCNRVYPPFTMEQTIGSNCEDWVTPDCRRKVREAIQSVFASGQGSHYETAGVGRNGELAWYSTRISPVVIEGQVTSAILICSDMTQRQQAEGALRDSEERFRQLASSIDEGFWLVALYPERLLYVNPAFERIWGVPTEQLYGEVRGGEKWIHPDDLPMVNQRVDDWFAGRRDDFDLEYRIVRPDGSTRWIRDRGAKILDETGRLYRASGIVRDITDQKLAEKALRSSEARYRLLADHSSDLITRHSLDGRWKYLSPASHVMLGFRADELVGLDPFEFIHADDRGRCLLLLRNIVETRADQSATYRVRRADGRYIWLESKAKPIFDSLTGAVAEVVVTSRDVTERIESTRQLRQREADLAHAERLSTMGQMASEMAHELNQPLYAIANFADACLGRLQQQPAGNQGDLVPWIQQIAQQARRAGDVVRRITQFVRKGELDRELLDLNRCIREASVLLDFCSRSREIDVEYQLAAGLPRVVADRLLIEQVLLNLVRNAAEAMDEVSDQARRLVIRTFQEEPGTIGVAVSDSGRGLPAEYIDRLFEPYFTTKADGTGMGLAICRSTIEGHEGRIWAQNNPEGGATFLFVLPVPPSNDGHPA